MRRDTRGVSTVVSHALALGIVAILVVGLVAGVGGLLDDQQGAARAEQLDAIGGRLASDLATADRLAEDDTAMTMASSAPRSLGSGEYTVHLVPDGTTAVLYVNATGSDDSTRIAVRTESEVRESRVQGGPLSVVVRTESDDQYLTIERSA